MTVALVLHRADGVPISTSSAGRRSAEFMYLLAGGVQLAGSDGSVLSANAGDALFVVQGAPIGWESSERVAEFYVVQNVQS